MHRSVKYNDVDKYKYLTVLGITGVYIDERVNENTLPEGFLHYELEKSRDRAVPFSAVGKMFRRGYGGDFITKEELPIPMKGKVSLTDKDFSFPEIEFQFEPFFGTKLSIDKQIENAELIREIRQLKVPGKPKDKDSSEDDEFFSPEE